MLLQQIEQHPEVELFKLQLQPTKLKAISTKPNQICICICKYLLNLKLTNYRPGNWQLEYFLKTTGLKRLLAVKKEVFKNIVFSKEQKEFNPWLCPHFLNWNSYNWNSWPFLFLSNICVLKDEGTINSIGILSY